ncbi:MAG: 4-hydroxythreonine-4-phosphate dehydrogenase PdxA [Hydrogenophaga sp.]|uniref:PdxA family dehydrogenase n=1 Tax=Hydrogenophaga sp. TaxID=1904254 RepID=UPI00257EFAD5|nr:4-hydroxythreonine-4-phosphate dehydrogenase PdxA [Hydrogenophaga sp.]MBL0945154.1 4-hydroxythreonine-4-phosphate dehydrogenase PdxA [Hydrogenophaga sp.]
MSPRAPRSTRIGVAIGDPNGIGPEIAVRAALALHEAEGTRCLLFAEHWLIAAVCERLAIDPAAAQRAFEVRHCGALAPGDWQPGAVSAAAGAATVAYVRAAVDAERAGEIGAVGAAPHCEAAVNASGRPFSGYSGLLAELLGLPAGRAHLFLEACGLRVVHATLHESVRAAAARLRPEMVLAAARAARDTLLSWGVAEPRLCVVGINPHAGENGLFGDEDEDVTKPAVQAMRALGWRVDGPLAADVALSERRHDAYVAMLHDQGHIAVKMLCPKGATAWVAGIPLRFASVGHGAAFDIAGQGRADATALSDTLVLLHRVLHTP